MAGIQGLAVKSCDSFSVFACKFKNFFNRIVYCESCNILRDLSSHFISEDFITCSQACLVFVVYFLHDWRKFWWWRCNWDFIWVFGYAWFVREACFVACLVWNFSLTFFSDVSWKVGTILDLSCEGQVHCFTSVGFDLVLSQCDCNLLTVNLNLFWSKCCFAKSCSCTTCAICEFKYVYQGIMYFKGVRICWNFRVDMVSELFVTSLKSFSWLAVDIFLDFWLTWGWRCYWDCVRVFGYTWFVREVYLVACLVWNFSLTIFSDVSWKVCAILDLSCEAQFHRLTSVGFDLVFCKCQGNGLAINLDLFWSDCFSVQACTWRTSEFKNIFQGIGYCKGCCVCWNTCVDIVSESIITVYKGFSRFFVDILLDLWFFRSWRCHWNYIRIFSKVWFIREVRNVASLVWNLSLTIFSDVSWKVCAILDLSCEAQFHRLTSVGFDLVFCKCQGNGLAINLDLFWSDCFSVQACTWRTSEFKNIFQGIGYCKGCCCLRHFCRYIVSKDFITFIKSRSFFVVNVFLDFWLIWCWRCYRNFVRVFVHLRFVREASCVACLVWNLGLTIFDVSWKVRICFDLSREGQLNSFTAVSFDLVFCKRQGNGLTFNLDLFSWNCLTVEGRTCTSCRICEFKNIYQSIFDRKGCCISWYFCIYIVSKFFSSRLQCFSFFAVDIFLDAWFTWCWRCYRNFVRVLMVFRIVINIIRSLVRNFSCTCRCGVSWKVCAILDLSLEGYFDRLASICFHRSFCKCNLNDLIFDCHSRFLTSVFSIDLHSCRSIFTNKLQDIFQFVSDFKDGCIGRHFCCKSIGELFITFR